jgi:hypothetical protein
LYLHERDHHSQVARERRDMQRPRSALPCSLGLFIRAQRQQHLHRLEFPEARRQVERPPSVRRLCERVELP